MAERTGRDEEQEENAREEQRLKREVEEMEFAGK